MFYLIELTTYNNGTNPAQSMYNYDDKDTAVSYLHSKLGSMMRSETCASEMCAVIDSTGVMVQRVYWTAPVTETVEEIEVEETTDA